MISLLYRILGDASPLKRTLDGTGKDAREAGSNAGKYFGQQFKSQVLRFVGIGAVVGQVNKMMSEATRIRAEAAKEGIGVEGFQELTRAAELTGMTIDELRKAAPEISQPLSDLMAAIRESGGILDKDTVESLSAAAAELKSFTRDLAPIVSSLVSGLTWLKSVTSAGVQKTIGDVISVGAKLTGSQSLWASATAWRQSAGEEFERRGGGADLRSRETAASDAVIGALHTRRQQRAALAGAIVAGMPSVERAVGAAGKGVPFFGPIAEDMLKEMKKSTAELERLSSVMNQKL